MRLELALVVFGSMAFSPDARRATRPSPPRSQAPTPKPTNRRPYAANNTYCNMLVPIGKRSDDACVSCLQSGCDYCYDTMKTHRSLCFDGNLQNLSSSKQGGCRDLDLYYSYYPKNAETVCLSRNEASCNGGCIAAIVCGIVSLVVCCCVGVACSTGHLTWAGVTGRKNGVVYAADSETVLGSYPPQQQQHHPQPHTIPHPGINPHPQMGHSQMGAYPQQGYPQQGYPQQGYPQQGYLQQFPMQGQPMMMQQGPGHPQQQMQMGAYPQQGYPQQYPGIQMQQYDPHNPPLVYATKVGDAHGVQG